ncbi:hypothetical protein NPIL_370271 [Nephila pilipes]|uniref:Uncharacterized protein n=1 Tax=Nephila pilipes TaxID=299642 RepID=A0A8X6TUW5_NEPPI|nr:hypothetical protein NPIL_370271 [Nephila pilipes]
MLELPKDNNVRKSYDNNVEDIRKSFDNNANNVIKFSLIMYDVRKSNYNNIRNSYDGNARNSYDSVDNGESFLNFAVTVLDKDSKDVNDLVVRIEDDSLNLFAVKDTRMYGNLGNGRNTFLSADIQSRSVLTFPEREYDFTVVIEDASLLQKDRMVIYKISVINETELELDLKDIYEINISSNAAPYSKIGNASHLVKVFLTCIFL